MYIQRDSRFYLYRFLFSHIFVIIALFDKDITFQNISVLWFLTVFLFNLVLSCGNSLKAIKFNESELKLSFNRFLFNHENIFNYEDLQFSYKKEAGARGIKSEEFRIYDKKKEKIISIGGFIDGWSENKINEIIEELKKKYVKEIE